MIDIRKTKKQLNKFLTECAHIPKKVLREGTDDWMGMSGAWGEETIDGEKIVVTTNEDLSECTIYFNEKPVTVAMDYEITDEENGFEGHISALCTTERFKHPITKKIMSVSFGVEGSKHGNQWSWDEVDVWNMEYVFSTGDRMESPELGGSKPDVTASRGGKRPSDTYKSGATFKKNMTEADGKYREDGVRVYKEGEKPDNGPIPRIGEKPDWMSKQVKTYSADEMDSRMNALKKVTARELPADWQKYAEDQGYDLSKASDDATTMVNQKSSNPIDVNELMYQILKDIEQPTNGMPANYDNYQRMQYINKRQNNLTGLFKLLWPEKYEELAQVRYNKWGFRSDWQKSR